MRKPMSVVGSSFAVFAFSAIATAGQDIVVDAEHTKLEFENDCAYVVRANYGPGEKSPGLFDTPFGAVIVNITAGRGFKLTFADSTSVILPDMQAGQVHWATGGGQIQPENPSNERVEYIAIVPKAGGCR